MKLALIDLGSNSARMYLLSLGGDGRFTLLTRRRVMTRLSEGMSGDGLLKPTPMSRTCETLQAFAAEIRQAGAYTIAIATAAVRKAKNREEFLQKVKEEAGLSLFVVSGELEAYFDFQGVMASLKNLTDCLICDTGGGSTELILVKDRTVAAKISLPFGAMSLTDAHGQKVLDAKDELLAQLAKVPFLEAAKRLPLVGIGGSVCALGSIDRKLRGMESPEDVNGYTLTGERVRELFDFLYPLSPGERMAHGVEPGRSDTVCAGFLPSLLLMEQLHSPRLTLCTGGLREGILAELEKENPEFFTKHPEQFLEKFV